jgi:hypothetical protein
VKHYLYRVRIAKYPEGALRPTSYCPDLMEINPDWEPEGWDPHPRWVALYGRDTGSSFFWPSTEREWRSRASARRLQRLLESYGATAVIQRSSEIVWPPDPELQ